MDRPGNDLCRVRDRAAWYRFTCKPLGRGRNIGTDHPILQRASPVGLLVWPP